MRGKIEATIKHKGGENFGNGSVARHILRLALPMTLAQFINVLYKILYLIFDYPHKHYTFKYFEV